MSDTLVIGDREFRSRLLLGTGKFPSNESLRDAIAAAESEIVTVALRRIDPTADEDILDAVPEGVLLLVNTSGAIDATLSLWVASAISGGGCWRGARPAWRRWRR